ncbi:hypothetical protein H0H92_009471 [Tricholoma furcatifolium]|nr:hypothetical protein H0H92_009471 [Tricholoma furcatifolium]
MSGKTALDVATASHHAAHDLGEEALNSPTNTLATTKDDLDATPSTPTTLVNPPVFPEGGLKAWLTVLGGTMVTFCTFGVVQSFGVYQDYYTRISLNEHTPSSISWIGSVQVFFVFAMGLPAGRFFDAGYFHHCVLGGSAIYIFSIFMLSLVKPHHYYQNFLAQGVGMGIGMGLMFLPSLQVTSHYFRRRRSIAMGFVISGSSIGGCVYPVLLNNVFARASGFGMGVRAVAFMDLGLLIIANSIMRAGLPPKRRGNEGGSILKEVITDGPYLLFVLGSFLLYAALHGVPSTFVKYTITVMNAASIFGRTVPNFLADIYGPLNIVSVVTPAAASFISRKDFSDLGIRIGLLSFTLAFALLTGNPIAGALLSPPHYKWDQPLIFAAVVTIAGALCHFIARRALAQRKDTHKL